MHLSSNVDYLMTLRKTKNYGIFADTSKRKSNLVALRFSQGLNLAFSKLSTEGNCS